MTLRPSISTLFPYTTLFRSWGGIRGGDVGDDVSVSEHYFSFGFLGDFLSSSAARIWSSCDERCPPSSSVSSWAPALRSEEHTSELQSLTNLVCRLLLEKKKK